MIDKRDPILLGVQLLLGRESLEGKPPLSQVADEVTDVPDYETPAARERLSRLNGALARVSRPPKL